MIMNLAMALVVGPYSGVSTDNLLATPALAMETVWEADAAGVMAVSSAGHLTTVGETARVATEEGFAMVLSLPLSQGQYRLTLECEAPHKGADSFFVDLDSRRIEHLLIPPIGVLGSASVSLTVPDDGTYEIRLTLREAPGSTLAGARLAKLETEPARPPVTDAMREARPRVLLTSERLEQLRSSVEQAVTAGVYRLPDPLTRQPSPYREGSRNGGAYRSLGDHILRYKLDPDPAQLQALSTWLEMATTYGDVGVDLDAEYFMEGIALGYDWLYDDLPADLRGRLGERIATLCEALYGASLSGRTGGGLSFQQNHYWYAHLALALGSAALIGEHPKADVWLAWAWDRFERVALTFSPDGSFHEGPAYWDFSMPTLYAFVDLYESLTGLPVPGMNDGLKGQGEFRFQHVLPGFEQSVALEDSRVGMGTSAAWLYRWEAARFDDRTLQALPDVLGKGPSSHKFALLWYAAALPPAVSPLRDIPLSRYYADVETVFARTSWSSDATYAAFVCRPLGGHSYANITSQYRGRIGGTGHNHPEQGHFVIASGNTILAGDPGYTYEKKTLNHNTILVDGQGQYGDGEMWPRPKPGRPEIEAFATHGDMTAIIANVTDAYPAELGLARFERRFVLAGPDLAVVYDVLESDEPRTFSWLLHHWGSVEEDGSSRLITVDEAALRVQPMLPTGVTAFDRTYRPQFVHPTRNLTPENADVNLLQLDSPEGTQTSFLVPMTIGSSAAPPPRIEAVSCEGGRAVVANDTVVAFRTTADTMTVTLPWGETASSTAEIMVIRRKDGGTVQRLVCPAD